MRFVRILALLGLVAVLGCGGGENATTVEEAPPDSQIQSALQSVAETGVVDSGIMLVRAQLEVLKETDALKADALLKDLDALEASRSPDQVKAKAKEMLGKL